jgi:catecholate siderophore receptor
MSSLLSKKALSVAVCGALGADLAQAQTETDSVETITVIEFRGREMSSPRYTRELIDIPRIVSVLPSDLLEEQDASSLQDAMRNVPGISLQAGEGNPPSGDQLKIRGYNARDDLNVNGVRDLGNYFRDPFYVDQIEIVKGPNSVYSGRGSAGGTINFVTKKPVQESFSTLESGAGTDNSPRLTFDTNRPVGESGAYRVNFMAHQSEIPGRDTAEEKRYGLYSAYTWGLSAGTQVTADYLHLRQDDIPDAGLPFDRDYRAGAGTGALPPGLDFDNFYGHIDDYREIDVDLLGVAVQRSLGDRATFHNQTRYGVVHNESITSSPRFATSAGAANDGTPCGADFFATVCARGDTKPRDQEDVGITNQTDVIFDFDTGAVAHDLVVGLELSDYSYENQRRPDTNGPTTSLYDPGSRRLADYAAQVPVYDSTLYGYETKGVGVYVLDTLAITPRLDVNAGLRFDRVEAAAWERGRENLRCNANGSFNASGAFACSNDAFERTDDETSYSIGVVYKLRDGMSFYASLGTAYTLSGNFDRNQVQLAGGANARVASASTFDTPAENTDAFEIGAKWLVGSDLNVNVAVFRTETSNGRFPAQAGGDAAILDTDYYINGFEMLAAGQVTDRWRLYSGYTYLDSEVTGSPSRSFAVGQELGGTPEHSFNVFTTFDVTRRFSFGGGLQYVAEQASGVQATPTGTLKVTIPSYTVVDIYTTYRFTDKTLVRLNVANAADERYIAALAEGGGQGIPGLGRNAQLTLRHDF